MTGTNLIAKSYGAVTRELLLRAVEQGKTLEQCASPLYMNRSIRTIRKWARLFDIAFPDYKPRKRKPKEPTE